MKAVHSPGKTELDYIEIFPPFFFFQQKTHDVSQCTEFSNSHMRRRRHLRLGTDSAGRNSNKTEVPLPADGSSSAWHGQRLGTRSPMGVRILRGRVDCQFIARRGRSRDERNGQVRDLHMYVLIDGRGSEFNYPPKKIN